MFIIHSPLQRKRIYFFLYYFLDGLSQNYHLLQFFPASFWLAAWPILAAELLRGHLVDIRKNLRVPDIGCKVCFCLVLLVARRNSRRGKVLCLLYISVANLFITIQNKNSPMVNFVQKITKLYFILLGLFMCIFHFK